SSFFGITEIFLSFFYGVFDNLRRYTERVGQCPNESAGAPEMARAIKTPLRFSPSKVRQVRLWSLAYEHKCAQRRYLPNCNRAVTSPRH
ncbi:MAG: hypothetical protein ACRD2L_06150, partial [Terriglobia bacterium]